MVDAMEALWNALHSGAPVVVVYYAHPGAREALLGDLEMLCAGRTLRVATLDEARSHPDRLCLLTPEDEEGAVIALDGGRDMHLNREEPIALFLLRDGSAMERLRTSPSLASWIRGNDIDPERLAQIDAAQARARFQAETGATPETWLASQGSEDPGSLEDAVRDHRARFLEER